MSNVGMVIEMKLLKCYEKPDLKYFLFSFSNGLN